MKKEKDRFILSIVGANRSGKDTLILEQIRSFKKDNKNGKVIAFDPKDSFVKSGLVDKKILITNKSWAKILQQKYKNGRYKYANSLVCLSNFRLLHPSDLLNRDLQDLLALSRRANISFIFSFYHSKNIITKLSYFFDNYIFLYTLRDGFNKQLPNWQRLWKASLLVNKYYDNLGGLKNIKYQNYPYIIINNSNLNLLYINMKGKNLLDVFQDMYFNEF